MQKSVTFLLVLLALLSSAAAAQSPAPGRAAQDSSALAQVKPKLLPTEPDAYVFSVERGVDGSATQTKESEQKLVGDVIHQIMKEHEYKDYETFRIDAESPAKNQNTYYVRFFKVKQAEEM